jgi:hypothetical protein
MPTGTRARLLAATTLALLLGACSTQPPAPSSAPPAPTVPPPAVEPEPETPAAAAIPSPPYRVRCNGRVTPLAEVLQPVVARLERQKIPYGRQPAREWRDCSGNFLRLSSYLADSCPEFADVLAAPAGIADFAPDGRNAVPLEPKARSNHDIALWYQEQGRFVPIAYDDASDITEAPADLHRYRNLISPGAVLWFANQPRSTGPRLRYNHMGTVTAVVHDRDGNVVGYSMYHGWGKPGNPAGVTKAHYWLWPDYYNKRDRYAPLGFWTQRLVGIGTLVPVLTGRQGAAVAARDAGE